MTGRGADGDCPVSRRAAEEPGAAFVLSADVRMSYGEADDEVERLVSRRPDLRPGRRIPAEWTRPLDVVLLLLAARRVGASVVVAPAASAAFSADAPPRSSDELLVVMTSGTSGAPKGVRLSRAAVHGSVVASNTFYGFGPDDRWLAAVPLWFVGGLAVVFRAAAAGGAVVLPERFDAAAVAACAVGHGATHLSLSPPLLAALLDLPGPFRGPRVIVAGGAPVPAAVRERAARAGLPVSYAYGMSETFSHVAATAPGETVPAGCVGRPLPGADVSVSGAEDGPGSPGRIVVRHAPGLFSGYLGAPDRTGPHVTGDLGFLDGEGRLHVTGRGDRVINSGGVKISPEAIEEAAAAYPGVSSAAALAEASETWGERPLLRVTPSPGVTLDPSALRVFLAGRLPKLAVPDTIEITEAPAVAPSGKPLPASRAGRP